VGGHSGRGAPARVPVRRGRREPVAGSDCSTAGTSKRPSSRSSETTGARSSESTTLGACGPRSSLGSFSLAAPIRADAVCAEPSWVGTASMDVPTRGVLFVYDEAGRWPEVRWVNGTGTASMTKLPASIEDAEYVDVGKSRRVLKGLVLRVEYRGNCWCSHRGQQPRLHVGLRLACSNRRTPA
jgi:hypothetical protein